MNHDIYLRLNGTTLEWSSTDGGSYSPVGPSSPSTTVNGTDTVTFHGGDGIKKIQKIDEKGSGKKLIKSKRGEDSNSVVVTIKDTTSTSDVDAYSIRVKPDGGGKPITVDPEFKGGGRP
ncbi:hypothetical protein [Ekhidna sp.]|uniref:hypothetical protein n=1 Tax=Ekhidna sp. TaxID=2608089 RepID=UPI003C7CD111